MAAPSAASPELVALGAGLDEVRARLAALDPEERSMVSRSWPQRAACRDVDPAPFFPVPDGPQARPAAYSAARPICDACEVWAICLDAGLGEPHGYRGRSTPAQRTALRRARGEKPPKYLGPGPTPPTTSP